MANQTEFNQSIQPKRNCKINHEYVDVRGKFKKFVRNLSFLHYCYLIKQIKDISFSCWHRLKRTSEAFVRTLEQVLDILSQACTDLLSSSRKNLLVLAVCKSLCKQ